MAKGRAYHRPFKTTTPTIYRGVKYGSKAEAQHAFELDLRLRAGRIQWWLRQVPIDIGEPGVDMPFRVDFVVCEEDGSVHADEVKGCDTPPFRRHVKQWAKRGPMPMHVIRGKKTEILPKGTDYGREDRDEAEAEAENEANPRPSDGGSSAGGRRAADDVASVRRPGRQRPKTS